MPVHRHSTPRAHLLVTPREHHVLIRLPTLHPEAALCIMCGLPMPIDREQTPCDPLAVELSGLRLETRWPTPDLAPCRVCGALARLDAAALCSRCLLLPASAAPRIPPSPSSAPPATAPPGDG